MPPAGLAERAFGDRALRRAWSEVLASDGADGQLSAGVARFEESLDEELVRLAADLAWGTYRPRDLTEVEVPKDAGTRLLHIPAVRDRIVERAILEAVTPHVDPHLGPASYAYRPGLGVADAVAAVAALRDEGLGWALRTDIDDCFPSVPVGLARRMLGSLVDDSDLLAVVDLLLARLAVVRGRGRRIPRGLPQGCSLSPMLANLVLTQLDERLMDAGFPLVRYADDLEVATESRDDAWEALRCASAAAEELGMSLGPEDTHIMSFEDGFAILGEDFGSRYPPAGGERIVEPEQRVVYVGTPGSRVNVQAGRLIVESKDDKVALDVANSHVARLVCFGAVGVSAGARSWALAHGVETVFASARGNYLGSMVGRSDDDRVGRLRRQLALGRGLDALPIARAIVEAKLTKQLVVLRRFARREHRDQTASARSALENMLLLVPNATSSEELMGLEGAGAAAYFPALGALLPLDLQFSLRSRQPPTDVANSALSFLYTVLLGECVTALYAVGLDPHVGVLHADEDHRPSLALDLLEEFRPLVVDQVVLEASRRRRLTSSHGRSEDGRPGVLLTRAGKEAVLDGYERRMLQVTRGALPGFAGSIRRHVYRQAQRLQRSIMTAGSPEAEPWTGLAWR